MANGLATVNVGRNRYRPGLTEMSSVAESLFDSVSVGVIFVDTAGFLTYMNKRAETIFQIDKRSVLGKRVDMLPLKTPIYKAVSENCRDCPLEMNILGQGFVVRSSEVKTADGMVLGEITELSDITAEKTERRQREEFVAMMTHDLKSPLMVMLGHVQAIRLGMCSTVDSQFRTSMEEIERSGCNLSSMIENLLDIYRLEMGLVQIKRRQCDIGEVLETSCRDARLYADERGIELLLSRQSEIPLVFIDGRQMSRVFDNLIGNAIKFTPSGGKVSVSAERRGEILQVSVTDNGVGIPGKDMTRIFNKYFRSDKVSGFKGTGLGLAISKTIVEAHGGIIEAESIEGRGSTFAVKIPIVRSE